MENNGNSSKLMQLAKSPDKQCMIILYYFSTFAYTIYNIV